MKTTTPYQQTQGHNGQLTKQIKNNRQSQHNK